MITRKTRRGIVALVILTAVSFWIGHGQDIDIMEPVSGLDPKLDYVLRDFDLQFYDENGQPTIKMQAPVLRNDPQLQLGTIEQPVIVLNQPGLVWKLVAESATVTADKEHVHLSGLVHVQRVDQATGDRVELNTRQVDIEVTPQIARSDQAVSIFDGFNQIDAIGFELDMKTESFKLKQQVKASYAIN